MQFRDAAGDGEAEAEAFAAGSGDAEEGFEDLLLGSGGKAGAGVSDLNDVFGGGGGGRYGNGASGRAMANGVADDVFESAA